MEQAPGSNGEQRTKPSYVRTLAVRRISSASFTQPLSWSVDFHKDLAFDFDSDSDLDPDHESESEREEVRKPHMFSLCVVRTCLSGTWPRMQT